TDKVRGANLEKLRALLEHAGILKSQAPQAPAGGGPTFGGYSAEWWQAQFREARAQIADVSQRASALERVAGDDVEKGVVRRLKEHKRILEASLDQLESDASN